MCIGIPMKVCSVEGTFALCEGRGEVRRLDTLLVGKVQIGDWVLAHLDWAREILDEDRAFMVNEALDALEVAMRGGDVSALFPDLGEPQLPEFLRGNR